MAEIFFVEPGEARLKPDEHDLPKKPFQAPFPQ